MENKKFQIKSNTMTMILPTLISSTKAKKTTKDRVNILRFNIGRFKIVYELSSTLCQSGKVYKYYCKCATDTRRSQQRGTQPQLLFSNLLAVDISVCMSNLVTLTLPLTTRQTQTKQQQQQQHRKR